MNAITMTANLIRNYLSRISNITPFSHHITLVIRDPGKKESMYFSSDSKPELVIDEINRMFKSKKDYITTTPASREIFTSIIPKQIRVRKIKF